MTRLRIKDAPLIETSVIQEDLKIPTGGYGDVVMNLSLLSDWVMKYKNIATKEYVNTTVSELSETFATKEYVFEKVEEMIEPLPDKEYVDSKVSNLSESMNKHLQDLNNPHKVNKNDVGLGNVNNTSDKDKPLSDIALERFKYINQNGAALPWMPDVEYALHAAVTKSDGTLVQSTVAGNKTNPNVDMTGWVYAAATKDSELVIWSRRTQESKNKEFITPADEGAKGGTNNDFDALNNLKARGQFQYIDITDRHTIEQPLILSWQAMQGRNSRNSGINGQVKIRSRGSIDNMRMNGNSTSDVDEIYAVSLEVDSQGVDSFYSRVSRCFFYGYNGLITTGGVETLISDCRFFGAQSSMSGEKYGTAINNRAIDNTLSNTYIERFKNGLDTGNSCESTNLHIVVADTALNVRASKGGYSQFVNGYIDSPLKIGVNLVDTNNVNFNNFRMFRPGRFAKSQGWTGDVVGYNFGGSSSYNRVFGSVFQDADKATTHSIKYNGDHLHNLFVGLAGDHTMSTSDANVQRKQINVGGGAEWAKYDSYKRKSRHAFPVTNLKDGEVTLEMIFTPSAELARRSDNFVIYEGSVAVRGFQSQGAFFKFTAVDNWDSLGFGESFKVEKILGHANISIVNAVVSTVDQNHVKCSVTIKDVTPEQKWVVATVECGLSLDPKGFYC